MIVVTGAPRTGTSLIMQTLALLGVPMAAPKFLPIHEPIKQFNENGFYELDIWSGVTTSEYDGKAIKLFGLQYSLTPKQLIKKTIVTERNKKEATESYDKLKRLLPKEYNVDSEQLYDANKKYIDDYKSDYIEIDLDEFKSSKNIEKIIDYLKIIPTAEQINNAKNNIQCQQPQ